MAVKPFAVQETGNAQDFTENEKNLMALQDLKEAVTKLKPLLNKTQLGQLATVYNALNLKLNQASFF